MSYSILYIDIYNTEDVGSHPIFCLTFHHDLMAMLQHYSTASFLRQIAHRHCRIIGSWFNHSCLEAMQHVG